MRIISYIKYDKTRIGMYFVELSLISTTITHFEKIFFDYYIF